MIKNGHCLSLARVVYRINHLDQETRMGVVRMSVEMDEKKGAGGEVSHKCCNMYGRPANETVGLLDCYTDGNAGRPDNER